MNRFLSVAVLTLLLCRAAPAGDIRVDILNSMKEEMNRNRQGLVIPGGGLMSMIAGPKVFFIGFRYTMFDVVNLTSKYGAIQQRDIGKRTIAYVQVRLGSYKMDNSPINSKGIGGYSPDWVYGPVKPNLEAIKTLFWSTTDAVFKSAVSQYMQKQGEMSNRVEDPDRPPDFSVEKPEHHIDRPRPLAIDADQWTAMLNKGSARFEKYPWIRDSSVGMWGKRQTEIITNTEGTEVIQEKHLFFFGIHCSAWNKEGELEGQDYQLNTNRLEDLPSQEKVLSLVDQTASELKQLLTAEKQPPYDGPAILWPEATGVYFHEALGHRLEGDRLRTDYAGDTFKGKIGQKIIPDFLSVYDYPCSTTFNGTTLVGHYDYDEDGVRAQDVCLVKDGVLQNFLMGRSPTKDFQKSNGHGRANAFRQPMARMGNLFIVPSSTISYDELKARLIEECKKQNKPYGLIVKSMYGGDTNTTDWSYQAFKQSPRLMYRVNLDTGEETLVRGAEIVGTPLAAVKSILACSKPMGVMNGYCGSLSGSVPVSSVAPTVLCASIELQKADYYKGRPSSVKPPFAEEGSAPANEKTAQPAGKPESGSGSGSPQ